MLRKIKIREIQPQDNQQVAKLIKEVLLQLNAPKEGTAYADTSLHTMYETYQNARSKYFVATYEDAVVAGDGIAPLEGEEDYCELQKMYVAAPYRKQGVANNLINKCFKAARQLDFSAMYLETLPIMKAAQIFYKKHNFTYLAEPLGNTGHTSCTVRMLKHF